MAAVVPDPSSLVEVELNVGDPAYLHLAVMVYGEETEYWWKELGDLLYGRPGWYCELTSDPDARLMWSFGAVGSSLFNITYNGEPGYSLYDYYADTTTLFPAITALREWLEENEDRHADHPRKLRDIAASNDWGTLKTVGFDVDVTHDNAVWIATVRKLPVTMSPAESLATAVVHIREAIAAAFDAPISIADAIQVKVHLDNAAVAALSN